MKRKSLVFVSLCAFAIFTFSSTILGVDHPDLTKIKSGLKSIYDPPDRLPPEHPVDLTKLLSSDIIFYPVMGEIASPGDTVGFTYYEYQKNGSMGRQIALDKDSGKHFNWMDAEDIMPGNRWVDYNYVDSSGIWLGGMHVTPNGARGGYTNIELLSDYREVLCYHHSMPAYPDDEETNCMLAIEDSTPGTGSFNTYDIPDALPGTEYNAMWPYVAADSIDHIHVVMWESDWRPGIQVIGYTRCYEDAESLKCEAPGVPEINIPPNATQPSSNMASVVDSTGTISHIIVSSPVSNKVAIIYTRSRHAVAFQIDSDVYYIESTNGGQDWIDAGSFSGITKHNITNYSSSDMERAYTDVAAVYDYDDSLHICWNAHWFDDSAAQYSNRYASLYHWSKATGRTKITQAYWDDTSPGSWNRNIGKMSISVKESNGNIYVIWTQFNPGDKSAVGYSNGDIYASASTDDGLCWDMPTNLTNTSTPGCSPGDCESDHWSTLAEGIDDSLYIFHVNDRDAGASVREEGSWTQNPILYMKYPAWNPLPHPRIAVDHQIYEDVNVNNYSSTDTIFRVENFGNAQLDVSVSSSASWIEITCNSSFSIAKAGNPVEVCVKLDGTSYSDVILGDSIIVISNDSAGNDRIVLPVWLVVTDEYYFPEFTVRENSTMRVKQSNLGSVVNEDTLNGMYTLADDRYYIYDGCVFLATVNSSGDTLVSRHIFSNKFAHAASNLVVDTLYIGDYSIIRSKAKFWPFFPDIGTPWPGWWWGMEMSMENQIFLGENSPVPENVMITSVDFYPSDQPLWWPPDSPPDLGDLYLGMILDWDVPGDSIPKNSGGYDQDYYLVWQLGYPNYPRDYYAGMSFLDSLDPYSAKLVSNPSPFYPKGGFLDQELYQLVSMEGDTVMGQQIDLISVMTAKHLTYLTDTVRIGFALAVGEDNQIDLKNDINKARLYYGAPSGAPPGDVNNDGTVDSSDVEYLFSYIFSAGPEPVLWGSADMDGFRGVNIGDYVYLSDHIYESGLAPQRPPFAAVPETLTTDTLYISYDSRPEVGKYVFKLELANSDSVFALAIPLEFEIGGGAMVCDSISFASTRVENFGRQSCRIDTLGQKLLMGLADLSDSGLPPGSGLIAKLYFTLSDPLWCWSFSFDTTFIEPCNDLLLAYRHPADLAVPQFEASLALPPCPSFAASPTIGEKPLEVSFTDSSTGGISSWYWSFGDGDTSSQQHPVHTYTQAGYYDVMLKITGEYRSDSLTKEKYIRILDRPLADFVAEPTSGAPPLGVRFTDKSIGRNIFSWWWNFGDGSTDTVQNPYHVYQSFAKYDVSLTVQDSLGTGSVTKNHFINTYPTGDSVHVPNVTAYPNQQDVVIPILQSNESDSLSAFVIPLTFGDTSVVYIDSVSFANSRAAHFNVLGGDILHEDGNILVGGVAFYPPGLPVGQGIIAEIYLKVKDVVPPAVVTFDTAFVPPANTLYFVDWQSQIIEPRPGFCAGTLYVAYQLVADFMAGPTSGGAPLIVQFTDSSAGSPNSWRWDFGDGDTADIPDPIHTYVDTGYFDVKLVVSDSVNNIDSLTKHNLIHVTPHVCRIINVPGDYPTIQEAIDSAWDCDTVLVDRGIYYENINFLGKSILLASNFIFDSLKITIDSTIIDAGFSGSGILFVSGEDSNSIIEGFTVRNGRGTDFNGYGHRRGGGLLCYASSPMVSNNYICANFADSGGGVFCHHSSATITKNIIRDNHAGSGGGIFCDSSCPVISNNTIASNSAYRFDGAGISCMDHSSPAIENNTITENWADGSHGGGIYCYNSCSPVVKNNIVSNSPEGEGIYCGGGSSPVISWNDVCSNAGGNFLGCPAGVGDTTWGTNINGTPCDSFFNIIRDPEFCEPDSDNYHLFDTSPCLGAGESGKSIGALGVGCFHELPVLAWTGEVGYETDGVSPDTGINETLFEFRIVYTDSSDIPPAPGFPRINMDVNGDGDFEDDDEGSFTMGPVDADTIYSDGKIYYYNTTLPITSACQYSFSARNELGAPATGEPTNFRAGPVVSDSDLDLYIHASDITFSESNPAEGSTFTVYATVHNNSSSNLSDISVNFYDGENPLGQKIIPYIPSRSSAQTSIDTFFSTTGFYPIKVVVDEENSFDEWNELNNWAIRPIKVGNYPVEGEIIVDASVNSPVYTGTWINITGNARYYPIEWEKVCGARVTATIQETGKQYITYTNNLGNFNKGFWGPDNAGTYNIIVEVTDFTLTGYDTLTLEVISQDKPDLIVDVQVSGEFLVGRTLTVTTKVSNIGGGPAYDFKTQLYRDGSYLCDEDKSSLSPGENFWLSEQLISFEEVGTHCIKAITDVENSVDEFNEANNQDIDCFYVADTIIDLKVDYYDVTVSNTTPGNGQPITILGKVHNLGKTAAYSVPVRFYLDSAPFGDDVIIPEIQAAQFQQVTSSETWSVDFNKHLVQVMADPDNVFTESNEANNRGALPLPYDLYPYYYFRCPGYWPYFFSKCNSFVDQQVTIYGSVRNRGGFDLTGEVNVQISDNLEGILGVIPVSSILNHKQNYSTGSIDTFFTEIGTHTVTATVDYDNQYDEWNEGSDNVYSNTIFVDSLRPDLMIHSDHIEPSDIVPDAAETVDITATVYNIGQVTAENVSVQFLMDDLQLGDLVDIDFIPTGTENYRTVQSTEPWIANCEPNLHICKVKVDPNLEITELDETNNDATRSIIACGAPDLFVDTVMFGCKRELGYYDSIYAVVKDTGKYAATAQAEFYYYDADSIPRYIGSDEVYVPELGGTDTAEAVWWSVMDSTHICVLIKNSDPVEYDTTNNSLCILFRSFVRGDVIGDGEIGLADVVYLINYILKGGPEPVPAEEVGDVNFDGEVTLADVVYLINYLFKGGPAPCEEEQLALTREWIFHTR